MPGISGPKQSNEQNKLIELGKEQASGGTMYTKFISGATLSQIILLKPRLVVALQFRGQF